MREDVRGLLEEAVDRLAGDDDATSPVDRVADRLAPVVEDLAARIEATERRLDQTLTSVREAHESLVAHLVDRDRQVALERAHLTRAFVEELAGTLSRRERRRVARKLSVDRVASPPEAPEGPGRPPAPEPEDPEEPRPERVQPSRGTRPVRDRSSSPQDPAAM